jgi:hypothetical protein
MHGYPRHSLNTLSTTFITDHTAGAIMNAATATLETAAAITIAEDVRLDLGHTDLVGTLVFDGGGLVLVTPSGSTHLLGDHTSMDGKFQAPDGHILIEEVGLSRTLPAALVALGCFTETERHKGFSAWGADVVELRVIVPAGSEAK